MPFPLAAICSPVSFSAVSHPAKACFSLFLAARRYELRVEARDFRSFVSGPYTSTGWKSLTLEISLVSSATIERAPLPRYRNSRPRVSRGANRPSAAIASFAIPRFDPNYIETFPGTRFRPSLMSTKVHDRWVLEQPDYTPFFSEGRVRPTETALVRSVQSQSFQRRRADLAGISLGSRRS